MINEEKEETDDDSDWESVYDEDDAYRLGSETTLPPSPPAVSAKLYRLALFSVALVLLLPLLQINPIACVGVRGGMIARATIEAEPERSMLTTRDDSQTQVCKRWSGQSAVVNGTLYMYGFRTTMDSQQQDKTWCKFIHCHFKFLFLLVPYLHSY